ncbi:MAG: thioredoxin domain-containing protein [Hymenobacteraceae bacterium]|mgnify:CR=1 FL=1|nr:thioredoxin domain-containing protein [Hymenobacteraceae bacterium]MDX5395306.1 thioredoxin domain-containing protein [Hymenobacteraceae bacterium]MDX5442902.1 thioredoxin domain-containing protein [Hymenobacteraceae bacterium]MDX5511340.1 thioredoxin domain-containing protein [Hymenobacteraceae bacterium]
MKKTTALMAGALLMAGASFAQNRAIKFETGTFSEVLAKAKKENKPIFMDAYTTWCGPCIWMDKNIFTNDTVADFYNQNFIAYKSDMEKGEGVELAKRYQVQAYPSLLYIDGDGNILHRSIGARQAAGLVSLGKDALNPEVRWSTYQKRYNAGERNPEFMAKYLTMKGEIALDISNELEEYFATQKDQELALRRNWKLIYYFASSSESAFFQRFVKNRSSFVSIFTPDSVDQVILGVYERDLQAALYQENAEKQKQLKTDLEKLKVKDGNRVIWYAETKAFDKSGDLKNYCLTACKLVDSYYINDPAMLNKFAWRFYEKINDKAMLQKAEGWARRAAEIKPEYAVLDTHAAVLYKLGKKKDAKLAAEKAIATGKQSGEDVKETEALLKKINSL